MNDRQKYVRDAGIATVERSGAVKINWQKAARSCLLRREITSMQRIYEMMRDESREELNDGD
jgi:hypothetical protein